MRALIDEAVELAWALANHEACQSGAPEIDPEHFVVGLLKLLDDDTVESLPKLDLPEGVARSIRGFRDDMSRVLGSDSRRIALSRRALRPILRGARAPAPNATLSRSPASRRAFARAAEQARLDGAPALQLAHLWTEMLGALRPDLLAALPSELHARVAATSLAAGAVTRSATPVLDEIARDLTELARVGRLAPVVGREAVLLEITRFLSRTMKRGVLLVGPAGVGKTAIVEGLAQRAVAADAIPELRELRILQIDVANLVAGARFRGDMEERVQRLLAEASADRRILLFLDEIHLVAQGAGGGMDLASLFKPALARDDLRCIGATTREEFERYLLPDSAFERRFQRIDLAPPTRSEALAIAASWARRIEELQEVEFEPDAVAASVTLSDRLITDRALPDKAIDLLENAAAFAKVSTLTDRGVSPTKARPRIDVALIEKVLREVSGVVRVEDLPSSEELRSSLQASLVGQSRAIEGIVDAFAALSSVRSRRNGPRAVLLLCGATGVGKTLAAETLANVLDPKGEQRLLRINMSELVESHQLSRLVGAPPGFIGHEREGQLFSFARAARHGVILLDEFEKAHPDIHDYFLQIFEKGVARDSRGRETSLAGMVFVLTSNLTRETRRNVGFARDPEQSTTDRALLEALRKRLRPELLARVDRIIEFGDLTNADLDELFNRQWTALSNEVAAEAGTDLCVDLGSRPAIVAACSGDALGARGFVRRFEQLVVTTVRRELARSHARRAQVFWRDGSIVCQTDDGAAIEA